MEEVMPSLLVVRPDGTFAPVKNEFEAIKAALDGAILTFVGLTPDTGAFIDDEGMLKRLRLNVPVSIYCGRALWGPAVLCAADTDDEGNTLLPPEKAAKALAMLGWLWNHAEQDAERAGQTIEVYADPDTIPLPEIIPLTDEMLRQLFGIEED